MIRRKMYSFDRVLCVVFLFFFLTFFYYPTAAALWYIFRTLASSGRHEKNTFTPIL